MKVLKEARVRTEEDKKKLTQTVGDMIDDVKKRKDEALKEYSQRFDGSKRTSFLVTKEEIREAYDQLTEQEIQDLKKAAEHIRAFARAQRETIKPLENFSPAPGIFLGHRIIPVKSCCCYVPGGNYPLYSTALMLVIPAKAAGVERVAACSPVMKGTDRINPKTLAAMDIAGADEIYAVGGAQAIAAFSYGTEEIRPVDMIVGPGNQYVTEAKRQCYGQVGIDFVAGPSEVLVIADGSGTPEIVAADLLAQSEHDPNAKGMLITTDEKFGQAVIQAVEKELSWLPTASIAKKSWETYGEVVLADSLEEALQIANDYAPEHLELNVQEPEALKEQLYNYGSLFMGENTAEVFGDYASGTNHTLPHIESCQIYRRCMGRYFPENLYPSEHDPGGYERSGSSGRKNGSGRGINGPCPGRKGTERKINLEKPGRMC